MNADKAVLAIISFVFQLAGTLILGFFTGNWWIPFAVFLWIWGNNMQLGLRTLRS